MPAITEVRLPNQPSNGVVSVKSIACRQSTVPLRIGTSDERKASAAETVAIGIASRATHLIPQKFTRVNAITIAEAPAATGRPGRYHCWMAEADRIAVNPQVGTQPHQ